jgi:hypothetical protein
MELVDSFKLTHIQLFKKKMFVEFAFLPAVLPKSGNL